MKPGIQYPITPCELRILRLLVRHPGLQMHEAAALLWPGGSRLKQAAFPLRCLIRTGYVRQKLLPVGWYKAPVMPTMHFYVTETGYNVYAYYAKQRDAGQREYIDGQPRASRSPFRARPIVRFGLGAPYGQAAQSLAHAH